MTLPYKPLSWADNEVLNTDKLNAMTNNDQWLFENMPRVTFAGNAKKTSGVKMLATRGIVAPNNSAAGSTVVYFGSTFSVGCNPIVVATSVPSDYKRRFHTVVRGIGSLMLPDHTGCQVIVSSAEVNPTIMKLTSNVYVMVVAIGY